MDVAHGLPPAHAVGARATSPPPRPAIPPKPDKIGLKSNAGTQANFSRLSATDGFAFSAKSPPQSGKTGQCPFFNLGGGAELTGIPRSSNIRNSVTSNSSESQLSSSNPTTPRSPLNPFSTPSTPGISPPANENSRNSLKPALPPKPTLLNSPPTSKFPPPKPPPLNFASIDNANQFNNNNGPSSPPTAPAGGHVNGSLHSPPPFLRSKPPPSSPRGEPLIRSPSAQPTSPPSRPNSSTFFNFSSPIQNLNRANFPSTSAGLNQSGGVISPQRRAEARTKSASLGRNITFPFTSTSSTPPSSSGGFTSIFSRKSATLSKFLPAMDLQIGGGGPRLPTGNNNVKSKPNSLQLNPFIIQQKQQQAQAQGLQQNFIKPQQTPQAQQQNFGRRIVFSPESAMPPPPPPRQKKKLSPVNSLGSPNSPISPGVPICKNPSFLHTELPPPPPISPASQAMNAVVESAEEVNAIYAEVNKAQKWADRKLKEQRKYSLDSSVPEPSSPASSPSNINNKVDSSQARNKSVDFLCDSQKSALSKSFNHKGVHFEDNNNINIENGGENSSPNKVGEGEVVDSWLGKYLSKSVATNENASASNEFIRSSTPTFQAVKTGHIYETIGDDSNANKSDDTKESVNNNNDYNNEKSGNALEIELHETSQIIPEDDSDNLSTNKSFLFGKLVISPKVKSAEASPSPAPPLEISVAECENHVTSETLVEEEMKSVNSGTIKMTAATNESDEAGSQTVIAAEVQPSATNATTFHDHETEKKVVSDDTPPPPPPRLNPPQKQESVTVTATGIPMSTYLIPTVIQDLPSSSEEKMRPPQTIQNEAVSARTIETEQSGALVDVDHQNDFPFPSPPVITNSTSTPSRASSILRRRSWNGDRLDSPSPSESSSTSSNYHLASQGAERSFTSPSVKENRNSLLLDEEDLSTGALADAESSDVPLKSSAEDINSQGAASITLTPSSSTASASKGFAARRSRLNSFFGSFGKGSSSSSGGSGKKAGMRHANNGGKRPKEKTQSHFFMNDTNAMNASPGKMGRQVSDSLISTSKMVSSPILPTSMSFDGGLVHHHHKSPSVQFSPDVTEARIIYPEHFSSAEECVGSDHHSHDNCSRTNNRQSLVSTSTGEVDDESISSSESVSVSGSVSGYEDILAELSEKEKKSFYVAREILTSERTFVDVLNLLTVDFPRAVDNASRFHNLPVITNEDFDIIKGGLPNLKRVNEDLLSDLEERIAHWKEFPKIADILVKKGPFLKLYATYIKDFQKNSLHLDTCCQRFPYFAATIREFEMSDRCQKLGIKHYMLKPVQRMPQYRLLLEDYLKSLEKDSEDYADTIKGIAIVKDVAEHANEAIRLQVNAEKLLHLQSRIYGGTIILKSDRQLLKEGELDKVCRKDLQTRVLALMNDCLLCLTYNKGGAPKDLKLRYELPLAGMRVSESSAEDYQNEFSVISVTRSFNLVAKSPRDRDDWIKALNSAIHDNIKKRTCNTPEDETSFQLGKEAPVWVQDSRVTMCQLCTAEFTVTFRRHHCRACGKVVCGNCSGNHAPLQYCQNTSSRVCDSCYEYLLDEFDKLGGIDKDDSDDRLRASLRDKFRKDTPNVSKRATKIKRAVPARLEVHANSSGSRMNGYLQWREREKKSWKRRWFVLIDRVLYIYAASEDIVALKSIPLLGWQIELDRSDTPEGEETQWCFRLTHVGHHSILFQADSLTTAEKWIAAMKEAVVL